MPEFAARSSPSRIRQQVKLVKKNLKIQEVSNEYYNLHHSRRDNSHAIRL